MNKDRNEKIADLLYEAGYRLHGKHWKRTIDSRGCGLLDWEQRINDKGGIDFGTDPEEILRQEAREMENQLAGCDEDEIEASQELYFMRVWLTDARTLLDPV